MRERSESWLFGLAVASAATVLVSIAAGQILLWTAYLLWLVFRPRPLRIPTYVIPLGAFMAATVLSLLMSADPHAGEVIVFRKFLLFPMGLLAANFITTEWRARLTYRILLVIGAFGSGVAIIQFIIRYHQFLVSGLRVDDPTVAARVTGFMGHWMTFSGEQMLVWCAAIPMILVMGQRWIAPLSTIGIGIILSFTRSVWLGAAAGVSSIALALPRKLLLTVLLPVIVVGLATSGLIYHRLAMSMEPGFAPDLSRVAYLKVGIMMVHDHPLFGVGPERIGIEFPHYDHKNDLNTFYYGHLHNDFTQIAAERGLLCLAAFFWFLLELYAGLWRIFTTGNDMVRLAALSSLAVLTGFLVAGLFEYNFGDSEVTMVFLFLVSLPFGLSDAALLARKPQPSPLPVHNELLSHG